jgi:hypothetical protein
MKIVKKKNGNFSFTTETVEDQNLLENAFRALEWTYYTRARITQGDDMKAHVEAMLSPVGCMRSEYLKDSGTAASYAWNFQ